MLCVYTHAYISSLSCSMFIIETHFDFSRYLVAELKCPTKERLTKLASFLVESIDRVTYCCPMSSYAETSQNSCYIPRVINEDILKIARGEDVLAVRYINSSSSSSSSSSPLQKQR